MEQYKYNCIHGGGEYHGYVFAEGGQTVFEAHYPQFHYDEELGEKVEELTLFDLGIMKNTLDVIGLQNHLRNLNLIGPDAVIVMDSEKADKGAVIQSITGGVHSTVNPVIGYADGGEIHKVADSMTDSEYNKKFSQLNDKQKKKYETLVGLGDSPKLALATVLLHKETEWDESTTKAYTMADGGETPQQSDELMEKIRAILKEELPNFYTFVKKGKNAISGDEYLVILMAASNYEINRVRGQYPQAVSLMLNLKDMDLHPQVFGGNGGQSIYLIPDKNDPKEKYLAMASRKVPFRRPKPNEKAVLEAIRKFAINYRNLLKENKDRLKYGSSEPEFQRYVDYDNLLDYYADGGSTKGYNPAQEVIDSIYGSAGTVYRVAADLGDGNVGLTPWYTKAVIDDVIKDIADSGYKILNVEQKDEYMEGGQIHEADGTFYYPVTFRTYRNFPATWRVLFVWGKNNYVSVRKVTNNPFGMLGTEFKNLDEAISHYKSGEMKVLLLQAADVAKKAGYPNSKEAGGMIGDSANVKAENKTGVIMKVSGGKYQLKFVDGTQKSYTADELIFIENDDDYAYGGPTDWKIDLFKEGGKAKKSFKEMTFKEKSASIQAKLRGRKVSPKYRKKYGKTYDSKEAKEAADAITGKIVSKMKE